MFCFFFCGENFDQRAEEAFYYDKNNEWIIKFRQIKC